jgi:hypothetical protein
VKSLLLFLMMLGHHSVAASYDASKPTTLQGVITKMEFRNPHSVMVLDVRNASASVTSWRVEIGGPNALATVGLDKTLLEPGKSLSIEVWPALDGSNHAAGRKLTLSDGRTFDVSDKWGMNLQELR